jgi:DNA end-binding protein Ku
MEAMKETGKVGIAKVVIRQKENLVALRPMEVEGQTVLGMATMIFADEVVDPRRLDELGDDVEVNERELDIAKQLVESLAGSFEPEQYSDTYREKVLELIEAKAAGEEIAVQPQVEEAAPVPDLMAALKASLEAVRSGDSDKPAPAKKKPAAKKPPAKKKAAAAKK